MAASLARLLLLLALLGQTLIAPTAGGRAAGEGAAPVCGATHSAASALSRFARPVEQAPEQDQAHRHIACGFCEIGTGGPALLSRLDWIAPRRFHAVAPRAAFSFAGTPFSRDRHNARTRAPPAFLA